MGADDANAGVIGAAIVMSFSVVWVASCVQVHESEESAPTLAGPLLKAQDDDEGDIAPMGPEVSSSIDDGGGGPASGNTDVETAGNDPLRLATCLALAPARVPTKERF